MKIYVVGSSKNKFIPLDNIRKKFLIDEKHTGNNIDFLNPWFCELTGLYHLVKNCNDEIIGLEHYRRYFWSKSKDKLLSENEIIEILSNYDVIVDGYKYPAFGKQYLIQELNKCTKNKVEPFLKTLAIKDKGLSDYFRKYLNSQWLYCCNCFIGPKKIIEEWLDFFIDVIIEFEKTNPIGPGTNTNRREGYFSEFLFGAWLEYKGYNLKLITLKRYKK